VRRIPRPARVPTLADDVWTAILHAVPGVARRPDLLDEYTPAIRQLSAMSRLNAEVNNGGYSQLFYNGGGVVLDDAIAGFAAAGLDGHRQVTVDAADFLIPRIGALVAAQRTPSLEAYAAWAAASGLDAFDDRWYALPDVLPALTGFIDEHAAEIWEPTA
jgi:hypothetical protein